MRELFIDKEWCDTLCRCPMLSNSDEQLCAKMIQRGGRAKKRAAEKLVEANIKFVIKYCGKWTGNGIDFEDLVSVGIGGMMDAANRFKPTGVRFISYARWEVRNKIQLEIASFKHAVTLPINTVTETLMIAKSEERFKGTTGRLPDREDLLGMGHHNGRIDAGIVYRSPRLSIDKEPEYGNSRSGDYCSATVKELRSGDETDKIMLDNSIASVVGSILGLLKEREKMVIVELFGIGGGEERTLQQIGDELGLSRERIRQIKEDVFSKVRGEKLNKRGKAVHGWTEFEDIRREVAMWE